MSEQNLERARSMCEAMLSASEAGFDPDRLLRTVASEDLLDPQVEWDASEVPMPIQPS